MTSRFFCVCITTNGNKYRMLDNIQTIERQILSAIASVECVYQLKAKTEIQPAFHYLFK